MTSHNLNSDLSVEQPLFPSISAQCNDIYTSVNLEHVSFNPLADRLKPEELNPLQQASIIPLEHDILSTRGYARNLGALKYRELILNNKLSFEDGNAVDKANIVNMIVEDLRPGRFLKSKRKHRSKDGDPKGKTEPSVPGVLEVMNPSAVNTKIKNALRDCPSDRNQIHKLLLCQQIQRQKMMDGTINKKVNKRKSTGTTNKISKRNRKSSTDSEEKTTPEMSSEYNCKRTESFGGTSAKISKMNRNLSTDSEQKTIPEMSSEYNCKRTESFGGTSAKISKTNRNISTDSEQKTTPEMSNEYNCKRTESFGTTSAKISKLNRNISTDSEQKTTLEMSSEYNCKRTESFGATSASKQKAALEINNEYFQSTLPIATLVPEQKTFPQSQGEHNCKTIESARTSSKDWAYDFYYQEQVVQLSEMSSDSKLHVSAEEIADFIEQMIEKGKQRRLKNSNHDSGWFNPDRQYLVRMQLLKRCYVAVNSPLSLPEFFTKFSEGLFGEAYIY